MYLLPDSSRVNRLWLGWVLCLSILWALHRLIASLIPLRLDSPSDVQCVFHHPLQLWCVCECFQQHYDVCGFNSKQASVHTLIVMTEHAAWCF